MISLQTTAGGGRGLGAFAVPELLSLLCSFSSVRECAVLSRTCRAIFRISTAFVWNHVDGGQHLLALLSGTRTVDSVKYQGKKKICIGLASSQTDFSRFDVYAPYVRRLNVYGTAGQYYEVEGWDHLIRHAQQAPLLPNLISITLQSSCLNAQDQVLWIKSFISPSLVNIQTTPHELSPPFISLIEADVILATIAERCSRLFRLSMFPSRTPHHNANNLLAFFWRRPYIDSLRALPSLIELTCSTTMLERDSLRVISRMPQLRRLTVLTSGTSVVLSSPELPHDAFPHLSELHLRGLDSYEVVAILGVQALMSGITHLELKFRPNQFDEEEDEDRDEWIASELLGLLRNAPRLRSLDLDLDPNRSNDEPYDIGHQDLMDILSKLPLAKLVMSGVHLGDWAYTGSLRSVWPHVTHLAMRDQFASPLILSCFSQLPRVEYLLLNVVLEDFREYPKVGSMCPLHTLDCSPGGSTVCEPDQLEYTGRFLLALFPNLRTILWPEDKSGESNEALAHGRFIGFLNQHIRMKREMNELRVMLGMAP